MTDKLSKKVGVDAPSWLVDLSKEDHSLDVVKTYRRLSRLRIVQGSTPEAKARIKEFGEGSVITVPGASKIASAKEGFLFVPLFMFTEYIQWSDRDDTETDMIVKKTFDKVSELAMKAKDKNRRIENYGPPDKKYAYKFVEHLVFPGVIYGGDFHLTPVTISFEKGEYFKGTNFCSAITMRKAGPATAPLWSQIWELRSGDGETGHRNDKYEWWGFDFATPSFGEEELKSRGGSFIYEGEVDTFRQLHQDLAEKFEDQALEVDRTDGDEIVVDPISDSLD